MEKQESDKILDLLEGLYIHMDKQFSNIRQEMDNLRIELKQDMDNLRTELKQDMDNLRTELKQETAELRVDVRHSTESIVDLRNGLKPINVTLHEHDADIRLLKRAVNQL